MRPFGAATIELMRRKSPGPAPRWWFYLRPATGGAAQNITRLVVNTDWLLDWTLEREYADITASDLTITIADSERFVYYFLLNYGAADLEVWLGCQGPSGGAGEQTMAFWGTVTLADLERGRRLDNTELIDLHVRSYLAAYEALPCRLLPGLSGSQRPAGVMALPAVMDVLVGQLNEWERPTVLDAQYARLPAGSELTVSSWIEGDPDIRGQACYFVYAETDNEWRCYWYAKSIRGSTPYDSLRHIWIDKTTTTVVYDEELTGGNWGLEHAYFLDGGPDYVLFVRCRREHNGIGTRSLRELRLCGGVIVLNRQGRIAGNWAYTHQWNDGTVTWRPTGYIAVDLRANPPEVVMALRGHANEDETLVSAHRLATLTVEELRLDQDWSFVSTDTADGAPVGALLIHPTSQSRRFWAVYWNSDGDCGVREWGRNNLSNWHPLSGRVVLEHFIELGGYWPEFWRLIGERDAVGFSRADPRRRVFSGAHVRYDPDWQVLRSDQPLFYDEVSPEYADLLKEGDRISVERNGNVETVTVYHVWGPRAATVTPEPTGWTEELEFWAWPNPCWPKALRLGSSPRVIDPPGEYAFLTEFWPNGRPDEDTWAYGVENVNGSHADREPSYCFAHGPDLTRGPTLQNTEDTYELCPFVRLEENRYLGYAANPYKWQALNINRARAVEVSLRSAPLVDMDEASLESWSVRELLTWLCEATAHAITVLPRKVDGKVVIQVRPRQVLPPAYTLSGQDFTADGLVLTALNPTRVTVVSQGNTWTSPSYFTRGHRALVVNNNGVPASVGSQLCDYLRSVFDALTVRLSGTLDFAVWVEVLDSVSVTLGRPNIFVQGVVTRASLRSSGKVEVEICGQLLDAPGQWIQPRQEVSSE